MATRTSRSRPHISDPVTSTAAHALPGCLHELLTVAGHVTLVRTEMIGDF